MAIRKFTLRSGTVLQVDDMAPFEVCVPIVEVIKKSMRDAARQAAGDRPITEVDDSEVGDAVASDPNVRKAVVDVFPWVIYGTDRMSLGLLNDADNGARVRGDYFEIISRVVEVIARPFFPQTSSESTRQEEVATNGQASPLQQAIT